VLRNNKNEFHYDMKATATFNPGAGYSPHIDGLRAVAILLVVFYHAGFGITGGFIGVDVFFVISGYLISGIVLRSISKGTFSIWNFWERRIRRLMPALFAFLTITFVASWFLLLPNAFISFAKSAIAQLLLLSNVYFFRNTGYFDAPAHAQPLLHTWSLAVEEQFYLLFPLLCFFLIKNKVFSRISIRSWFIVGWLVSLIICIYGTHRNPTGAFYLLPARAWELLTGAILATIRLDTPTPPWQRTLISWIGLGMIGTAAVAFNAKTPFPGCAALLPCLGTAAILWAGAHGASPVKSALENGGMVLIGKMSYSLYILHWPLFAFANYWAAGTVSLPWRILIVVVALVLAYLSWRWIENPFRFGSIINTQAKAFSFALSGIFVLFLAAIIIITHHGFKTRFNENALAYADSLTESYFTNDMIADDVKKGEYSMIGDPHATHKPYSFVVWGDSHAMAMLPGVDKLAKTRGVKGCAFTRSSTAPILEFTSNEFTGTTRDNMMDFNRAVFDWLVNSGIKKVLLVGYWEARYKDNLPSFTSKLLATVDALQNHKIEVWFMRDVPGYEMNVPKRLAWAATFGGGVDRLGKTIVQHRAASVEETQLVAKLQAKGVHILDPVPCLSDDAGFCPIQFQGHALYRDYHHLSKFGAEQLQPMLDGFIR
jgi:peptidoglycan/LPS O-acetylase OafA/YrhL